MTVIRRRDDPEGVAVVDDLVAAYPHILAVKLVVMDDENAQKARNQLQALSIRARNEQCKSRQSDLRGELQTHIRQVLNQQIIEVDTLGSSWEEARDAVELNELVRLFAVVAGQVEHEPLWKLVASAMK